MARVLRITAGLLVFALVGGMASPASAQGEGVKVHGQWTIDVRNEDGTIVSHDEFHNDLVVTVAAGPSALAGLLSRRRVAGNWWMYVSNADFTAGPCRLSVVDLSYPCAITEALPVNAPSPSDPPYVVRTLTLNVPMAPAFDLATGTIELEGVVRSVTASRIERVATGLETCSAAMLTAQCVASSSSAVQQEFTARTLPVPVVVGAGQIVQIKVIFSFS